LLFYKCLHAGVEGLSASFGRRGSAKVPRQLCMHESRAESWLAVRVTVKGLAKSTVVDEFLSAISYAGMFQKLSSNYTDGCIFSIALE
jgi:hypothetical protein